MTPSQCVHNNQVSDLTLLHSCAESPAAHASTSEGYPAVPVASETDSVATDPSTLLPLALHNCCRSIRNPHTTQLSLSRISHMYLLRPPPRVPFPCPVFAPPSLLSKTDTGHFHFLVRGFREILMVHDSFRNSSDFLAHLVLTGSASFRNTRSLVQIRPRRRETVNSTVTTISPIASPSGAPSHQRVALTIHGANKLR